MNIPLSLTTNPSDSQALINYFPHLSDVILYKKGKWKTLKYKLHQSLLLKYHRDRDRIIGVRFGKETKYLAADIDHGSSVHPAKNPIAFGKFLEAMEKIGLTEYIKVQSSSSEGLHIYFSLPKAVNTFNAACLMRWTCLNAGLIITPGHLELFPNVKEYVPYSPNNKEQRFSLYNGLRLPCQPGTGSFVLDDDFNPHSDRIETFLDWAEQDAAGQDFDKFKRYLRSAKKRLKKIEKKLSKNLSQNAVDWKEDLEEIIATGWTGPSETNDLISRIVRYAIVFMCQSGKSLRACVKKIIVNCPGYEQWCNHRHEIDRRIEDWCRSTEKHKRYLSYRNFPLKVPFKKVYGEGNDTKPKNQNDLAAVAASERIKRTVEKLKSEDKFPDGAVARTEAIAIASKEMFGAAITKRTLRRKHNLLLWHPKHEIAQTQIEHDVTAHQKEVITANCPQTQTEREPSPSLNREMTKNVRPQTQTEREPSPSLSFMKCLPKASAEKQISSEQASSPRGELVSKPEHSESNPPMTQKKINSASSEVCQYDRVVEDLSHRTLEDTAEHHRELQLERNHLGTVEGAFRQTDDLKLSEPSRSNALVEYGKIVRIKSKLESQIKILTREEIHRKYPGSKTIPKSARISIESSWRARLYWESGIPRLMKRSEEIWRNELKEDW